MQENLVINGPFVEINQNKAKKYYKSSDYKTFINNTVDGCATTTIQGLYAIDVLLKNNFLNKNDIIVNGNSGDFISGGHIPHMQNFNIKEKNVDLLYNEVTEMQFNKHYALWNSLISENNKKIIKELLNKQIKKNTYYFNKGFMLQGVSEFLEYEIDSLNSLVTAKDFLKHTD